MVNELIVLFNATVSATQLIQHQVWLSWY